MAKPFRINRISSERLYVTPNDYKVLNIHNEISYKDDIYYFDLLEVVDSEPRYYYNKYISYFKDENGEFYRDNHDIIRKIIKDPWLCFLYSITAGGNSLIRTNNTFIGKLDHIYDLERVFNLIKTPTGDYYTNSKLSEHSIFNKKRIEKFLSWYVKCDGYDYEAFVEEIKIFTADGNRNAYHKINTVCNMLINGVMPSKMPYTFYRRNDIEEMITINKLDYLNSDK